MARALVRDELELRPEAAPPVPSPRRRPSAPRLQALEAVEPPKMRVVEKGWTFKESRRSVAEVLELAREAEGPGPA